MRPTRRGWTRPGPTRHPRASRLGRAQALARIDYESAALSSCPRASPKAPGSCSDQDDADGTVYSASPPPRPLLTAPACFSLAPGGTIPTPPSPPELAPFTRDVGARLGDRDAGLLTHLGALANWHDTQHPLPRSDGHPHGARPGGTSPLPATAPSHFPRIHPRDQGCPDPDDRSCLARNGRLPGRRSRSWPGSSTPRIAARR